MPPSTSTGTGTPLDEALAAIGGATDFGVELGVGSEVVDVSFRVSAAVGAVSVDLVFVVEVADAGTTVLDDV